MDPKTRAEHDNEIIASRLFARLQQEAPGYEWDASVPPFHSVRQNTPGHRLVR